MKLATTIFASLASISAVVSGAAIPTDGFSDITQRQDPEQPAIVDIVTAASYLFGWEIAGAATSQKELVSACDNIASIGHGKWAGIRLIIDFIRAPICEASTSAPNPKAAVLHLVEYNTDLLAIQLANSFTGKADYEYLCNNIRSSMVNSFPLVGSEIKSAVCNVAGSQSASLSERNAPTANPKAVTKANDLGTIIYAQEWAAGAVTKAQLNALCADAPSHVPNINKMNLNGALWKSTVCNFKEVITVNQARKNLEESSSQYFVTVVKNISNVSNWTQWLCRNVDVAKMEAIGLDGEYVHEQFCL
ncbi:hypothetical protein LTR37_005702 [Vermiconidia calcicola]|uniref:Uncharacterized protein n=1 Tax=Vermiconidia calcicola TaxID=1690605 RepID=A0ACC3NIL5_9PEZI|nr:hypothetical protein LTR37_005702 [Vermiconidia calcicola]